MTDSPPAQRHSPTSVEAARSVAPVAGTLRRGVLDKLLSLGEHGATDEELQDLLGMPQNTERPRRIELVAAGLAVDSGRTRKTKSNRSAVEWIASNPEVSHV